MNKKQERIDKFRNHIEKCYKNSLTGYKGSFDTILCYELHSQTINPRMTVKTLNDGCHTGLTFVELAEKWGISLTFLGELIANHCRRLEK